MNDDPEADIEQNIFSGKGGFGFKEIVLNHLRKILLINCVEFRGGFYTKEMTEHGLKETYTEDTREKLCNSVYALSSVLVPSMDEPCKEEYKKFKNSIETIKKEFLDATKIEEKVVLSEAFYTGTSEKIALETYRQQKLELHHSLFISLNELLSRKNYFGVGGGTFA